jgi:hypothetical protein
MGAVGVGGAIHLPDFEVVDLVTFGQLCEGKASVSGGQINDLANICGILGIENVTSEELTTETVEAVGPEMLDWTGQVGVAV